MEKENKRKVVIIGIDGGTFKIIDPMIKRGELPVLDDLMRSGASGILKSTYPPITAAAWVSFMTGKNPGKHGFFDFREYNPKEYILSNIPLEKDAVSENVQNLHSSRFHGQTIWDFLSEAGYEINVVAVPVTYPPWKINGRMVAGYPSPDYDKPKTYPPEWSEEIGRIFNMSAVNYSKLDEFIIECKELVKRKGKIILEQMKSKKGEVFAVVFSSSDFAQHYFWQFLEQQNHMYSSVISEIYKEIDKVAGQILDHCEENTTVAVMSDHGFMKHPVKYFNVNSWLLRESYISLKKNSGAVKINILTGILNYFLDQLKNRKAHWRILLREKISRMPAFIQRWAAQKYYQSDLIDWDKTKAYRFKMYGTIDGIVINQKDRQERGIIDPVNDFEKLRNEIIDKLLKERDPATGKNIVVEAHRREDLYQGEYLDSAPDIVIMLNEDYIGGVDLEGDVISLVSEDVKETLSGIHDQDGILILKSVNVKKGIKINFADIVDVTPTILYDLNLPIPDDLDGKILYDIFNDSYKKNLPVYYSRTARLENKQDLSSEDEESVKESLRSLGYLE